MIFIIIYLEFHRRIPKHAQAIRRKMSKQDLFTIMALQSLQNKEKRKKRIEEAKIAKLRQDSISKAESYQSSK